MKQKHVLLVLLLAITNSMYARVWYVDQDNTSGTYDGTTWGTAFQEIDDVDAVASNGDEVWVAKGSYTPSTPGSSPTTYKLLDHISYYGGFDPTDNVIKFSQRDFVTYETIIDGLNTKEHVVQCNNCVSTLLDGFIIENGQHATLPASFQDGSGAGIHVYRGEGLVIRNCVIRNNEAKYYAGGIYVESSVEITIEDCKIHDNSTQADGGGIVTEYSTDCQINNCRFEANSSLSNAGAFATFESSTTINNCEFLSNEAQGAGAVLSSNYSSPGSGYLTIYNSLFYDNDATASYGGAFAGGNCDMINCTVTGNHAGVYGGGVMGLGSLYNCIVWGNTAPNHPNIWGSTSGPDIYYSLIEGSGGSSSWTLPYGVDMGGNIDANPQFISSATNFKLQITSPAIDVGNNTYNSTTYDLAGNVRIYNTTIDMGAYEYGKRKWYVWEGGRGAENGTSWDNAFATVQEGLAAAEYGDDIYVAEGTYYASYSGSRTETFVMEENVGMYGGYSPDNGAVDEEGRDYVAFETILSGDVGADKSYRVITNDNNGLTNLSVLDGFVVEWGDNPYLMTPVISDQGIGAGMYNNNVHPTVRRCVFRNNTSGYYGGGVAVIDGDEFVLEKCKFENNSTYSYGGGCSFYNSHDLNVNNCYFVQNEVVSGGGGGLCLEVCNTDIDRCYFRENQADGGGGLYIRTSTGTIANVYNSVFEYNTAAAYGGAILSHSGNIVNCTVINNHSDLFGGGIHGEHSTTIQNCIVYFNTADGSGNNVYGNIFGGSNDPTVSYSDVEGGYTGTGNVAVNPNLQPLSSSLEWPMPDPAADLVPDHDPSSLLIEGGNNSAVPGYITSDLAGGTRIYNVTVDMGAIEAVFVKSFRFDPAYGDPKIYPNPGAEDFTLEFDNTWDADYLVTILDQSGRKLFTKTIRADQLTQTIDMRNYADGLYHIQIQNGSNTLTLKWVKQ